MTWSLSRMRKGNSGRTLALAVLAAVVAAGLFAATAEAGGRALFFPHLISGMGFETRLVLTNPSSVPARVTLAARRDDGALVAGPGVRNPAAVTVGPYQQVAIQAGEFFGLPSNVLHLGWIQAESDNSQLAALLFASTTGQPSGAAVEAGNELRTSLVGPVPFGLQSAIALANPNAAEAQGVLRLYDAAGQPRGQTSFTIRPQGHRSLFLNEATGGASSPAAGGHFEITSSVGLSGLEVITGLSGYTLAPLTTPSAGPFVFPHAVNGPEASTLLILQNASPFAVEARWRAWDSQGLPVRTERLTLLPSNGTFTRTVAEIFGLSASEQFQGTVVAELAPTAANVLEPARATGVALITQGSAISSLGAQTPASGPILLAQPPPSQEDGTSFRIVNPGASSAEAAWLAYSEAGELLDSGTASVAPQQVLSLEGIVPAGTRLLLLRGNTALAAYQLQPDSAGVWQALGGRRIPAIIGGAVPLSAHLGGAVLAEDGRASVEVPLGALDSDTPLFIASLTPATAPPVPVGQVLLAAFQAGPAGLRFRQPVTLEFPVLNAATLPEGTTLQIYDPVSRTYRSTDIAVRSGPGGTTLVANVSEFPPAGNVLVVLVPVPSGGTIGVITGTGAVAQLIPSGGAGGVVRTSDGGAAMVIPPGAVPTATTITVSSIPPGSLPPPPGNQTVLFAIQAEPSGMKFATPVTLHLRVPDSIQGRLPRRLALQIFNPLTNQYEPTGFQAVLSPDGGTLTASVTHFTIFVVLQPFQPFAAPLLPPGTEVRPLGIASVFITPPPAPTITSFAPSSGTAGTSVTITGTNFTGATEVKFNGVPAAFTVDSATQITATVPSGATTGKITVTTFGGTAISATDFIIAAAPTISSFTPGAGPVGTAVEITGANFTGATEVRFGASSEGPGGTPAASFSVVSDTSITAVVAAGTATGRIRVTTPGGTALSATDFIVGDAPTITSVLPNNGCGGVPGLPEGSTATVTIDGTNFANGATVTFNGTPASPVVFVSSTQLTTTIPAGATTGRVVVTNPGGLSGTSSFDFQITTTISGTCVPLYATDRGTLLPTAALTVLNPFTTAGTPNAGTLLPGAALTLLNPFTTAGTPSAGTLLPGAALTLLNPFTTAGTPSAGTLLPGAALTLLNPFTTAGTPSAGTLLPGAALTGSNISFTPMSGPPGTEVTITGAGFLDGQLGSRVTAVFIACNTNGSTAPIAAESFTVLDNNTIRAIVSSSANTNCPVQVVLVDGLVLTSGSNFTLGALPAELSVFLDDFPDPVTSAEVVSYDISVVNVGGASTDNVTVTDTLPAGMTIVSCTFQIGFASPTSCPAPSGQTQTVPLGTLTSGNFGFITIDATAPTVVSQTFLTNTASATTTSLETGTFDNQSTVTTTVNPVAGAPRFGGGPPGGIVNAFAIDAVSPDTIYAATGKAGVFKSTDTGSVWGAVNTGLTNLNVLALAITPNPGIVYAGTNGGGVFKSTNGGVSWAAANTGLPGFTVTSLAIDPENSSIIYLGLSSPAMVFKSTDGGATWCATGSDFASCGSGQVFSGGVQSLAIDPFVPSIVYAGTSSGFFRSTNGGGSWTQLNPTNTNIRAIAPDLFAPGTLYAGTPGGVFKTANRGGTWAAANTGLGNTNVRALITNPFLPGDVLAGTAGGVFRSQDGGENWTATNDGLVNLDVLALAAGLLCECSDEFFAGTNGGGVFDGFENGLPIFWDVHNSGLTASEVPALTLDPAFPTTFLFAGTNGAGVFLSSDYGGFWGDANGSSPTNLTAPFVRDLAAECCSNDFTTLYAGTAAGVFRTFDPSSGFPTWTAIGRTGTGLTNESVKALAIPAEAPDQIYAGTEGGGVFKTTNGGTSWSAVNGTSPSNITNLDITSLALNSSTSPSTVYAGTNGGGVFKSTDGGATWATFNNGLTTLAVNALFFDDGGSGMLYAGTAGGGVFKLDTTAGTPAWTQINTGLGANLTILALAVEPDSLTVYAGTATGGVFKTTDAVNWAAVNTGITNLRIRSLEVGNPFTTVFAGTDGGGVFKTTNGGTGWSPTGSD